MLITSSRDLIDFVPDAKSTAEDKKQIKYTFGPVDISSKRLDDEEKLKERIGVLSPIRRSEGTTHYINLISTVKMDQEP